MEKRVYNDPTWRKMLLETPSGFALFEVDEVALKEPDDIWVYFRNVTVAQKLLCVLGFVKFDDKSSAWGGETRPSKDLMALIQNFCDDKNPLYVQHADLQDVIVKNLSVKCSYDPNVADEVAWGLKSVLHEVIPEERDNITRDYCLPMSKGLQDFLKENSINVSPTMFTADFISEMGLAQYLNITLKQVPKILRESYDKHVCRIGESIENDLKYARVLARILIPELIPEYDLSKIVSSELALKIQEADRAATQYREKKLTIHDMETILGGLTHLLAVPKQRDDIMTQVKLMEAKLRKAELGMLEDTDGQSMREHRNLEHLKFRRTLLETPSGFSIFDVNEVVFKYPEHTWTWFTDPVDSREVVLALGFVEVHDKSIVRNSCNGPGKELSRLIQKLCADKRKLIVQDDDLKSVIEEKLEVKCYTKSSTGADSLDDLIWGLKYVLHEFIPQERDNLTEEYYLPMSMGLQRALKSHGVNGSPVKMDTTFVYFFGCLANLDFTSAFVPKIFRKSFDSRILGIGELIKDNLVYAQVTAKILVPESQREFDFFKVLPGNLAELAARLAKCKAKSGEAISAHDKKIILGVVQYLSTVPKRRDCFLRFLNGGSTEELQRIEEDCVMGANDALIDNWISSVTTKPLMVEDQVVQEAKKKTGKMELQNVEETDPEVEALCKNKSSDDKSVQGHEIGKGPAAEDDSSDKYLNVIYNKAIPNDETESNQQSNPFPDDSFEKFYTLEAEKSASTDDDSINLEASDVVKTQKQPESTSEKEDHLVVPKEADNADGRHYSIEQSSGNGTGHQVIGDEFAEDRLISSSNSPSEIISEASRKDDDTLTTVATQHSEKGTPMEDGYPSDPAVGSEQLEGVPTSVLSPEPEEAAKCSSEISEHEKQNMLSEYETQNSTVDGGTLESNATGGETSEQQDVVSKVDGTAVTKEDDTINTIGKNKCSEDKSIDGDDFDLSCQENLHTKIGEGHSSIAVVEESSDKNLNAIYNNEIPSDEAESNQQSKHMITDSFENIANIDVPVESSTEKSVGTEDDMLKLGKVGSHSHSETPDVKPQQQPDSTSETEGHLAVSEGADNVDEQHYPISEEGMPALSSAIGSAVEDSSSGENDMLQGTDDTENKEQNADTTIGPSSDKTEVAQNTNITEDTKEAGQSEATTGESNNLSDTDDTGNKEQNADTTGPASDDEPKVAQNTNIIEGGKTKDTTSEVISTTKSPEAAKEAHQSEATAEDPTSGESNNLRDAERKEQSADTKCPASDENKATQNTDVKGKTESTATSTTGDEPNEEKIIGSDRIHSSLRDLFNSGNLESSLNRDNENSENTGKTKETFDSEDTDSGDDERANTTKEIFDSENNGKSEEKANTTKEIFDSENNGKSEETLDSEDPYTENGGHEKTNTTKEKTARSKICLHLFRGRSSKDNMSVSTKDNASLSPKDTKCGKVVCMWRFR